MSLSLLTRFVPAAANPGDPQSRRRVGQFAGGVGIGLNLLLFGGKFLAGLLTGSIAVTADAFNNLSDAGSSVVTLAGFYMAGKRADAEHPFGHGRMEYLAGLLVSLLILLVGVELGRDSLSRLLDPAPVSLTPLAAAILAVSIGVKLWMGWFNRTLGRAIDSAAMGATAVDCLSDAVATAVVLVSALLARFTDFPVDGVAGLLVALLIFKAGWGAAKATLDPLLGQPPNPRLVADIRAVILAHPEILGIHDLILHDYGPGRSMMSLHAEVDASSDVMALHDVIDGIERELHAKFGLLTSVHMDPIATDDELVSATRRQVVDLVAAVAPGLTLHDFRMTAGPLHTNLIFDVVVPHQCALSDHQVEEAVRRAIAGLPGGPFFAVLQIDHSYTGEV